MKKSDKKYVYLVSLILVLLVSGGVYAAVSKTGKWQPGNQIDIYLNGVERTLQNAVDNDLVKGSSLSVGDVLSEPNPGHDFDEIWVSVNGNEMTLNQALAGEGLCGIENPTTTYTNNSIVAGHYATEIEVTVGGVIKSLQDAINNGDISEVGNCNPYPPGVILYILSNTLNYEISSYLDLQNTSVNNSNITLIVNSGVVVGSSSSSLPSITTGTLSLDSIVTIINNGRIQGVGGKGGNGGTASGVSGTDGEKGGNAIETSAKIIIDNQNGQIWSGGGGGGGGGWCNPNTGTGCWWADGGGGGGGAGTDFGVGGSAAYNNNGEPGTALLGGSGARGSGDYAQCAGGNGGDPGMPGTNAYTVTGTTCNQQRSGGASGASVVTNGNSLTWISQGDLKGSIV